VTKYLSYFIEIASGATISPSNECPDGKKTKKFNEFDDSDPRNTTSKGNLCLNDNQINGLLTPFLSNYYAIFFTVLTNE
jgi:hypothetical protein